MTSLSIRHGWLKSWLPRTLRDANGARAEVSTSSASGWSPTSSGPISRGRLACQSSRGACSGFPAARAERGSPAPVGERDGAGRVQKPRKKGASVPRKRELMQPTRRWNRSCESRHRPSGGRARQLAEHSGGKPRRRAFERAIAPKRGPGNGGVTEGSQSTGWRGRRRPAGRRRPGELEARGPPPAPARSGGTCGGPSTDLITRLGSTISGCGALGSGGGTSPVLRRSREDHPHRLRPGLVPGHSASLGCREQVWVDATSGGQRAAVTQCSRCRRGDSSRGVGIARSSSGLEQAAVVGRWHLRMRSGGQRRTRHGPRTALSERRWSHRVTEAPAEEVGPENPATALASSRLRPDGVINGKRPAQRRLRLRTRQTQSGARV